MALPSKLAKDIVIHTHTWLIISCLGNHKLAGATLNAQILDQLATSTAILFSRDVTFFKFD